MKLTVSLSFLFSLLLVSCKGVDNSFVASSFQAPAECPIDSCIDQTINPRAMYANTNQKDYTVKANQSRIEVAGQCETSNVVDSEVVVKFGSTKLIPYKWYYLNSTSGSALALANVSGYIPDELSSATCDASSTTQTDVCRVFLAGRKKYSSSANPYTYIKIELADYQDQVSKTANGSNIIRCRNGQFRFIVDLRGTPSTMRVDLATEIIGKDSQLMEIRSLNSPTLFSIFKEQYCVGRLAFANTGASSFYYENPDDGNCVLHYLDSSNSPLAKWFQF